MFLKNVTIELLELVEQVEYHFFALLSHQFPLFRLLTIEPLPIKYVADYGK